MTTRNYAIFSELRGTESKRKAEMFRSGTCAWSYQTRLYPTLLGTLGNSYVRTLVWFGCAGPGFKDPVMGYPIFQGFSPQA